MEWLLHHLQSNRTRGNNTGKLMFTVACANESQVNKSIVPHFIKFHGNKQLFNTVFNLETSLTFALKYDPSYHLSWLMSSLCTSWQMTSSGCVWKHGVWCLTDQWCPKNAVQLGWFSGNSHTERMRRRKIIYFNSGPTLSVSYAWDDFGCQVGLINPRVIKIIIRTVLSIIKTKYIIVNVLKFRLINISKHSIEKIKH